jgi:predicted transcriptional regulator
MSKSLCEDVYAALVKMRSGTVREIAEEVGCTRPTVRKHLLTLRSKRRIGQWTETFRGRRDWWVMVYGPSPQPSPTGVEGAGEAEEAA